MHSEHVPQVIWQKILKEKKEMTANKFCGQRANPDFTKKLEFKNCALQNCSTVIDKVAER